MQLKQRETAQLLGLLEKMIQSPVLAGVLAYGLVSAGEKIAAYLPRSTAATSKTSQVNTALTQAQSNPVVSAVESYANEFFKLLPGGLGQLFGATLSSQGINPSSLGLSSISTSEFSALKLAIIAYIASGGNLAGLLSSIGSVASKV